jgi:hypothetical protein
MIEDILISDITGTKLAEIQEATTKVSCSWSLDAVSQITLEVHDPDLKFFLNNYFMVRRSVFFKDEYFEIASVEIDKGEGAGAKVTIECRRGEIQKMKRDKTPAAYGGVSATEYAQIVANKFGLGFVGEKTSVKRSIVKATGSKEDESVWDVLRRLAGSAQFNVFESNRTLFFGSQEWLVNTYNWANLPFDYPSPSYSPYQILTVPNCRRSDDDVNQAEVKFILQRTATTMGLRPGMTVTLTGMGEFNRRYLLTEIAYDDDQPEPIGVACRTPVEKKPNK